MATNNSKTLSKSRFYDMTVIDQNGQWYSLDNTRNKVVLVVNTASKCGFTPQYKGLEKLYKDLNAQYGEGNFEILAFPCNQFFKQEPGSDAEIQQFCETKYKITFPVFAKIDVNGPLASPLYKWLKTERKGFLGVGRIGWNFTKFVLDKDGNVRSRWAPATRPGALEKHLSELLEETKQE